MEASLFGRYSLAPPAVGRMYFLPPLCWALATGRALAKGTWAGLTECSPRRGFKGTCMCLPASFVPVIRHENGRPPTGDGGGAPSPCFWNEEARAVHLNLTCTLRRSSVESGRSLGGSLWSSPLSFWSCLLLQQKPALTEVKLV